MKSFVVYKSSAGSGKTFTLVREYLRLALQDEARVAYNFKKILAVTFTNRAAAEMKKRVLDALQDILSSDKMPVLGTMLLSDLAITEDALKKRCERLLGSIIHHYSDFSIGTLDSFTHKIVKTFAHDLRLPVNFNVELDIGAFYDKVIAQLLARIGEDEYISRLLKEYVLEKAEDSAAWDPEKQIREFAEMLQKENSSAYLGLLRNFTAEDFESFRKQFREFAADYNRNVKMLGKRALELISKAQLSDDDFKYKKSGAQGFFRKCAAGTATLADTAGTRLQEAISTGNWGAAASGIAPDLTVTARELCDYITDNYKYYSMCVLLAKQMYPLMLLKKIEELTTDQKAEDRLVFITEFNERIHEIINNEPAPFIYERLGERYSHYLVDEFQDTSTMQWLNMLPLLDNSLSTGWFNLVVGDGKQSIYRWRNANVRQFTALPEVVNPRGNSLIHERSATLARNYHEELLDVNYRSLRTVVEFNNTFFEFLEKTVNDEALSRIYASHAQKWRKDLTGYVTLDKGLFPREEAALNTLSLVEYHIRQALTNGFRPGDICVLARTNRYGSDIASHLVAADIPVVSSDSLLLANSPEVNVLVAFLSCLSNEDDDISAAAVLSYLRITERIDAASYHIAMRDLRTKPFAGILLAHGIDIDMRGIALNNLLDNCVMIARELRLDEHGSQYVRFFLDEVNSFLVTQNGSLPAFLEWWELRKSKASLIIPDKADAVKVMTIHASKGLEFPVVIVPHCTWPQYRPSDAWVSIKDQRAGLPVGVVSLSTRAGDSGFEEELGKEQQDQLIDNINLLYVAFTRAVQRLHIITVRSSGARQASVASWVEDYFSKFAVPLTENRSALGSPSEKVNHDEKEERSFLLDELRLGVASNAVRIKSSYFSNTEVSRDAREEGIILHWLLSQVDDITQTGKALDLGLSKGLYTREKTEGLRANLQAIVSHPKLRACFEKNANARRESEIVTANGEVLRPDLVVVTPQETIIIDYKTGAPLQKHHQQLQEYALALREMNYTNIRKLLVYVDPLEVVEVN